MKITIDKDILITEESNYTQVSRIIGYWSLFSEGIKTTKPAEKYLSGVRVKILNGADKGKIRTMNWDKFTNHYQQLPKRVKTNLN